MPRGGVYPHETAKAVYENVCSKVCGQGLHPSIHPSFTLETQTELPPCPKGCATQGEAGSAPQAHPEASGQMDIQPVVLAP